MEHPPEREMLCKRCEARGEGCGSSCAARVFKCVCVGFLLLLLLLLLLPLPRPASWLELPWPHARFYS